MIAPLDIDTLIKTIDYGLNKERLVFKSCCDVVNHESNTFIEVYIKISNSGLKTLSVSLVDATGYPFTFNVDGKTKTTKVVKQVKRMKRENYEKLFKMIDNDSSERYIISDNNEFKLI